MILSRNQLGEPLKCLKKTPEASEEELRNFETVIKDRFFGEGSGEAVLCSKKTGRLSGKLPTKKRVNWNDLK